MSNGRAWSWCILTCQVWKMRGVNTWGGGEGEWEFRLVADSGGAVSESDEQDNYSEATRVSIVLREGEAAPPPSSSGGEPKLFLAPPTIVGKQAGAGRIYAGSMTIAAKATNIGDGALPASRAGFQYAEGGGDWQEWVQVDMPPLLAGRSHTTTYNWGAEKASGISDFI